MEFLVNSNVCTTGISKKGVGLEWGGKLGDSSFGRDQLEAILGIVSALLRNPPKRTAGDVLVCTQMSGIELVY